MKEDEYVKNELIFFVKSIKKKTNRSKDKHLCDHLLWMIDDGYRLWLDKEKQKIKDKK